MTIIDAVTNRMKPGAPIVYLDEKTSYLWFNIPVQNGQTCDSSIMVNECQQACQSNGKDLLCFKNRSMS